jgi:hypothetical protein
LEGKAAEQRRKIALRCAEEVHEVQEHTGPLTLDQLNTRFLVAVALVANLNESKADSGKPGVAPPAEHVPQNTYKLMRTMWNWINTPTYGEARMRGDERREELRVIEADLEKLLSSQDVSSTASTFPAEDETGVAAEHVRDKERLTFLIRWLGMNDTLEGLGIRDWDDDNDAREAIDAAMQSASDKERERKNTDLGDKRGCVNTVLGSHTEGNV